MQAGQPGRLRLCVGKQTVVNPAGSPRSALAGPATWVGPARSWTGWSCGLREEEDTHVDSIVWACPAND